MELMSSLVCDLPTVLFSSHRAVLSPAQIVMEKCPVIRAPPAEMLTRETNERALLRHLLKEFQ